MDPIRHLRLATALVGVFLAAGIWLEAMIGLRAAGWVDDDVRRQFLRLGHAHGALLGVLNIALAVVMERIGTPEGWARWIRRAALVGAALVGLGFFVGGLWHGRADPGPAVLVVPAGAMMLLASCVAVAIARSDR